MLKFEEYLVDSFNVFDFSCNVDLAKQILNIIAPDFKGNLTEELFVNNELAILGSGKELWQQFYLKDLKTMQIVCSFRIIVKNGFKVVKCKKQSDGKVKFLLMTLVHTHPDYRKMGLLQRFISSVMENYQNELASLGEEVEFSLQSLKETDFEIYWYLYSVIDQYYKKFGFQSFDMEWLVFDKVYEDGLITLVEKDKKDKRNYNDDMELISLLYAKHFPKTVQRLLTSEKYLSFENFEGDNNISVSFQNHSLDFFFDRDNLICNEFNAGEPNRDRSIGLIIKHSHIGKETFVLFSCDLICSGLLLSKLFTNLDSNIRVERKLITNDMDIIVSHVIKTYLKNFNFLVNHPMFDKNFSKNLKISITKADVVAKDRETKDFIVNELLNNIFLKNGSWKLVQSNETHFLPMMKKADEEFGNKNTLKWINNGIWCFG
ncbi:hypothetical protein PACTADRAFT_33149 [Pachysolen tannophilus NRRL Y-2460]|uniref:N-acetyltransferase domain-containing protein n=1 Tax=Pachysolen tannophilus NRRL Y-2460 TaxID=669874 RepID=A0A1E4TW16_PACTA|nr:hypothetical protein PACTADRAFT_33149 [Pachysolen tannophilus NRRL Y-2460]